jgi:hypothetical protein
MSLDADRKGGEPTRRSAEKASSVIDPATAITGIFTSMALFPPLPGQATACWPQCFFHHGTNVADGSIKP